MQTRVAGSAKSRGEDPPWLRRRIESVDWERLSAALEADGFATIAGLLDDAECADLVALYAHQEHFRSRVVMDRHGFGSGEYQYFAAPLPPVVSTLREELYPRLAETANRWNASLRVAERFPPTLEEFARVCRAAGQTRPTPLLLRYRTGDFNRLHQDLYGEHVFPIQLTVLLSEPEAEFRGGQFVLTEQRPRMQSRVEVVSLSRGDAVLFAVNVRPVVTARGVARVHMRHGVSTVRAGERHTLGIIFHDAR